MLSQQNLIYLGIALLIVGIAFFAYQELQKHHTEIEKLRMQSQKLEKIIHAYNMRQWHQSTDPYLNDGAADSADSADDSNETDDSTDEDENGDMTSFIRQTLNSIGTPAGPSKVTISAGGKTVQFPVTPQPQITFSQKEDGDDIPDVDTFDVGRSNNVTGNGANGCEGGSNAGEEGEENSVGNFGGDNCKEGDGEMYEMEQNDIDINDDEKKNGETTICQVRIRKGERKGEICGSAAKAKGMCLRHYRETNKIH